MCNGLYATQWNRLPTTFSQIVYHDQHSDSTFPEFTAYPRRDRRAVHVHDIARPRPFPLNAATDVFRPISILNMPDTRHPFGAHTASSPSLSRLRVYQPPENSSSMPLAQLDIFTPEHALTHALLTASGRDAGTELIAQIRDRPALDTVRIRDFRHLETRTPPAENLADEFPTNRNHAPRRPRLPCSLRRRHRGRLHGQRRRMYCHRRKVPVRHRHQQTA